MRNAECGGEMLLRGALAVKSAISNRKSVIANRLSACLLAFLAASSLYAADVPFAEPDAPGMMSAPALTANLLQNGGFETGKFWPAHWEPVDKFGTLWVEGGTEGKRCLRMDTNIQDTQWAEWNTKALKLGDAALLRAQGNPDSLAMDPIPAPPQKLPTQAPYYDTVGGNHGIHYRSDFIKLDPGAIYRFIVAARTTAGGEPKVFIKGFFDESITTDQGRTVIKRDAGNAMLTLVKCNENWKRWVCVFHPARWKSMNNYKPLQPDWLRVDLYAYWPAGIYEFDNAQLEVIGHEAITAPPPPQAPEPKKSMPVAPTTEDEFPVIK